MTTVLLCLTANHQHTRFDLLEKLSTAGDDLGARIVEASPGVNGSVVVATCNRFEVYLDVDGDDATTEAAVDDALRVASEAGGVDEHELSAEVSRLSGDHVTSHLLAVSTGLKSVVVGEEQISGQVQRALEQARGNGTTSSELEKLFQYTAKASRSIKNSTGLNRLNRSIVRLALDMAETRIADWSDVRVLLIGTGAYASLSLQALRDRGAHLITGFSPSGRIRPFAARHGIDAVEGPDVERALGEADIVLACSSVESPVIDAELMSAARDLRPSDAELSSQIVIDLGLPRNIHPDVAGVGGVELADLEVIRRHAPLEQFSSAVDASALVEDAARAYEQRRRATEVSPAIVALRRHVNDAVEAEIARLRAGDADHAPATERALRHLAGVLVHSPTVRARELAVEGRGDEFVRGLEAVFGLEVPSSTEAPGLRAVSTGDSA